MSTTTDVDAFWKLIRKGKFAKQHKAGRKIREMVFKAKTGRALTAYRKQLLNTVLRRLDDRYHRLLAEAVAEFDAWDRCARPFNTDTRTAA